MEFRVLGALEVLRDGRALPLGGPRQRSVLAILLLRANQVVSNDRLIDELWAESPPDTARTALQVHVSQLRKVLGHDAIETGSNGYLLHVGDGELDLERFKKLVRRAGGGPPAEAAEHLREALLLWRGPALADLDEALARPERARLEEERMSALELRIAADLELGRHADLVPELEGLVREYPLRERLRGQLMLALYRSGRQADALEVYRAGRRLLDEELGLEPDEELRRLEQAILAQDPALASPAAAKVGLKAEERRLRLLRRSRVVAVVGALVFAGAVAALVIALTRESGTGMTVVANSVAVVDPETNRVVADIPVGARPIALAVGEGAIWVANADDGTVTRIDPGTREVVTTIGIGSPASDIAAGAGSVWVANGSEGTVSRIDPDTDAVIDSVDLSGADELVPAGAYNVAVGSAAVWVGSGQRKVFRIDPATGEVVASVPLAQVPADLAAGEEAVWAANLQGRAQRIEPATNQITGSVALAGVPMSIAAGGGAVWVGEPGEEAGTVWRIDPRTVSLTGSTAVLGVPRGLAVLRGTVWVAGGTAGTLVRIDAARGVVVETIRTGQAPLDVAVGDGMVWATIGSVEASTGPPSEP